MDNPGHMTLFKQGFLSIYYFFFSSCFFPFFSFHCLLMFCCCWYFILYCYHSLCPIYSLLYYSDYSQVFLFSFLMLLFLSIISSISNWSKYFTYFLLHPAIHLYGLGYNKYYWNILTFFRRLTFKEKNHFSFLGGGVVYKMASDKCNNLIQSLRKKKNGNFIPSEWNVEFLLWNKGSKQCRSI